MENHASQGNDSNFHHYFVIELLLEKYLFHREGIPKDAKIFY